MTAPKILAPYAFPRTGTAIRNRLVLAAMTNKQSHADGVLSDDELAWLAARARGGFGIVTTCAAHVSLDGQGWDGELGVYDDSLLPGLTRLADALRSEGAVSLVQIFHGGVRAPSRLTGQQPFSASAFELDDKNFEVPREATVEDIERTIAAFAAAAGRCAEAGFDGVEIHGAHGYLITQFLGTISNTRSDEWGGSQINRARFVRRIVAATREATPDNFLVGVRLSPEVAEQGVELDDSLTVAEWLAADGVDFIHVSNWDSFKPPAKHPQSEKMLTTWFREAVGADMPLIATGGVWTPTEADQVIAHGADMVGLARAAIGNASWPHDATRSDWDPARPPYTPEHLRDAALGEKMVDSMRLWPDFVSDGR
ncbi:MAG: 2,4-dienoyl-CoA reductase-like NADH-dependent reductase (Old Yellow Enzyme family) [Pseudohongiellaceae bacterium]|jgi:2,4-dienoyl-CoA reductase-like NADH-dependent reductase (Old Yellow Enzyme family)